MLLENLEEHLSYNKLKISRSRFRCAQTEIWTIKKLCLVYEPHTDDKDWYKNIKLQQVNHDCSVFFHEIMCSCA